MRKLPGELGRAGSQYDARVGIYEARYVERELICGVVGPRMSFLGMNDIRQEYCPTELPIGVAAMNATCPTVCSHGRVPSPGSSPYAFHPRPPARQPVAPSLPLLRIAILSAPLRRLHTMPARKADIQARAETPTRLHRRTIILPCRTMARWVTEVTSQLSAA